MNVVMTGVLSVWMAVNVHFAHDKAVQQVVQQVPVKQAEARQDDNSRTTVSVSFHLHRRTMVVHGPNGCLVIRDGQVAKKK